MSKIFWTEAERIKMINRGADLVAERPSLVGLELLRAAIKALPADRRRKVVAQSQARWFADAVVVEVKRRELVDRLAGDIVPIAVEHGAIFRDNRKLLADSLARLDTIQETLKLILDAVRRRP